jgi:hypothetical protein
MDSPLFAENLIGLTFFPYENDSPGEQATIKSPAGETGRRIKAS